VGQIKSAALAVSLQATVAALLLAGCSAAAPSLNTVESLPLEQSDPVPALQDSGSARDVADVKRTVQHALTIDLYVFDVTASGAPRLTAAQRTRLIDSVSTGTERDRLQDALRKQLGKPPFRTGGHFVVEQWQGVQVVGNHARAYVTGHSAYTPSADSSQRSDDSAQYQLLLLRSHKSWYVSAQRATSFDQG
jgi:hypothetical protein